MAETDLNKRVISALAGWNPFRVENSVGPGTPDIAFVGGWIEDKRFEFPKRASTIVRCEHFTTKQRAWHAKQYGSGGLSWVVIEDTRWGTVYVLRGNVAAEHFGFMRRPELIGLCQKPHCLRLSSWSNTQFRNFIQLECRRHAWPFGNN